MTNTQIPVAEDTPKLKGPRLVLLRRPSSIPLYFLLRKLTNYTMVPYEGLLQVRDMIRQLDSEKIEGSIVEAGCWKGGCSAFMAWSSKKNGSNRQTWMFDSFEGFPEGTQYDGDFDKKLSGKFKGHIATPKDHAEQIIKELGVSSLTHIVKGWFKDTMPEYRNKIGKIALLRLDGDLYSSTKEALENLYDQVSKGGYIVIDDYGYDGCTKALYDFFHEKGIAPELRTGAKFENTYFRKQ